MNNRGLLFCIRAGYLMLLWLFIWSAGDTRAQIQTVNNSPSIARPEALSYLGKAISLSLNGVPLKRVLAEISEKANIHFSYSEDVVPASKGVSLYVENLTVGEALDLALKETSVHWIPLDNGWVVLVPKAAALQETGTITGKVVDDAGAPIPFASVLIEGTTIGAAADARGQYVISRVPPGTYNVRASAIGYRARAESVPVKAGEAVNRDFVLSVDILRLEEVVVTGTMSPRQKLESTVAISTISPKEMTQASPRSTTEMLRYVPGFTRVESSGGEVNQNISVRGILGVEYVMFMEDGLPVFPTMHTFFMNADNLFRPDENIERVEVVRGGNSALFGSNTPGAIINFINKVGGPDIRGTVKATTGTEGLARVDMNLNGPLGERWQFNLGGFYRYDHGVRNPGFPGIRGGQLKASITRLLDKGFARLSAKLIDDRNQFILPLPFKNPKDPEYVPGFSDYGSMNTKEGNYVRVPIPNGELELPLEDGLRTKATWLTADIGFDFANNWSVRNTAQLMQNDQGWNAILPFDVMLASDWIAGLGLPAGSNPRLFFTNHFDARGNKLPFNTANGLVSPGGLWTVEKPLTAFQNQFTVSKKFNQHNLTGGLYLAHYTQQNRWYFTEILMDVRDNPRFLDLVYTDPATGRTIERTKNGFRNFLSFYVNGTGQTTIFSGVLGAEIQLSERLRADLGFRYEFNEFVQSVENGSTQDLDGDPITLYNNVFYGNGTFRHFSRSMSDWAGSLGLNYKVTDDWSVYAQGSRAYKMPALDEFLFGQAERQVELFKARQTQIGELGVKYATSRYGFTLNGFYALLKNIVGQGAVTDPRTGEITWILQTSPENRSYGAEFEVSANLIEGLNILGSGTALKAELGTGAGADIGSWINGVPSFLGNLAATYTKSGFTLLGDWHYVGARFADVKAGNKLPAYNYFNFGVSYAMPGQGITISADVLNAFQSKGLEEGNPRLTLVGGRTSDLFLARPILPRRFTLSLTYQF